MPLLPKFNALFIHAPRTSGTYLEDILGLDCQWPDTHLDKLFGRYDDAAGKHFTLQHMTCREILTHGFLPKDEFDRLFKFTMVRNPYSRCAGLYFYWGGAEKWGDYESFLSHLVGLDMDSYDHSAGHVDNTYHFLPQYKYVCDDQGDLLVDFVCRFESRHQDMQTLFGRIGFDAKNVTIKSGKYRGLRRFVWWYQQHARNLIGLRNLMTFLLNVRQKKKDRKYHGMYTDATRLLVRQIYAKDFDLFGYE